MEKMYKALSLCQPFASLIVHGLKTWETRSWKPGFANWYHIHDQEGLLIHASKSRRYMHLMGMAPFSNYLSTLGIIPFGAIIGRGRVGKIITTEQWVKEHKDNEKYDQTRIYEEWNFGDYSPDRFAWQILDPVKFDTSIPAKGSLSLWSFDHPLQLEI